MTATGTTSFNPASSDLILNAFSRIQIKGSELMTEHLLRAETEANLALVKLGNKQPNLWTSTLGTQVLTAGTPTYTLDSSVIALLICYLSVTSGGVTTDRVLGPLSTTEYASFPDKTTQGVPTSFWFDRTITPQLTFWPVPDDQSTYTAKYRYVRQIYDVSAKSGLTMDLPWRWFDAFSDELTARLSRHFRPDQYQMHKAIADESWNDAAGEDTEDVNMYITPGLSGFYR